MRKLTHNELTHISGAATMTHSGSSIIFTLNASEGSIEFNNMALNWDGEVFFMSGFFGGGTKYAHTQGEVLNGYQVYYSMGSNGIAQYTLIPEA